MKEYVDCMKEGQCDIDYITVEVLTAVSSSPFLGEPRQERFRGLVRG